MGQVIWARRSEAQAAFNLVPAPTKKSLRDFRPPPTIETDFERLLAHDVPHVNYTFE